MLIGRYDVMHRDHPRDEARYHDVTIPEQCMQMMVSCAECEGGISGSQRYTLFGAREWQKQQEEIQQPVRQKRNKHCHHQLLQQHREVTRRIRFRTHSVYVYNHIHFFLFLASIKRKGSPALVSWPPATTHTLEGGG